jgi:hypothetical protein
MRNVKAKTVRVTRSDETDVGYWFRSSSDVRTGYAFGNSFKMKPVKYGAVGGLAIFEGDIVLGTVEQMESIASAVADPESLPVNGIVVTGDPFRWPKGIIPYEIDPGLSNPQRVTDAMASWMELTMLKFVPHEAGNPEHVNYISIEEGDGCSSQVGMRGGKQAVSLGPGCGIGSAIHELGHVAGLWHEHSRQDRDQYVRIQWENIEEGREFNFDQHISDGDDVGTYDYASIMHYPALAFSKNGQPTIVPKGGEPIGQRIELSAGDVAAMRAIYGDATTPSPIPQPGSGTQRLGTIPAFDMRRWVTRDWPLEMGILWTVIPSPVSVRVEWNIVAERQSENLLTYYIEVRNLSPQEATIDVRYSVL